jgi:hypothetical protein
MNNKLSKQVPCGSFSEFLDSVVYGKKNVLNEPHERHLLFRGHILENYTLIPSALRNNNCITENEQIRNEILLLRKFEWIANRRGLQVPLNRKNIKILKDSVKGDIEKWVSEDLIDLVALAQHYRTPTRFLDWTYEPLTAMYFAASGAINKGIEAIQSGKVEDWLKQNMAIWQLDRGGVEGMERTEGMPLKVFTPMYYNIPNSSAQQGALTNWIVYQPFDQPIDTRPLEEKIEDFAKRSEVECEPILIKYTIPTMECSAILEKLHLLGYSASRLFPGYDGVTKEIEEIGNINKYDMLLKKSLGC